MKLRTFKVSNYDFNFSIWQHSHLVKVNRKEFMLVSFVNYVLGGWVKRDMATIYSTFSQFSLLENNFESPSDLFCCA